MILLTLPFSMLVSFQIYCSIRIEMDTQLDNSRENARDTITPEEKLKRARETMIMCTHCLSDFSLGNSEFIQDHYGHSSKTGNLVDCWHPSELPTCSIKCPLCSGLNYIYTHPQSRQVIIPIIIFMGLQKENIFKGILDRKGDQILSRQQ